MPGYGIPLLNGTFKATDADLTNKQFRCVKMSANRTVDFSTAATDLTIGIINNVPYAAAGADVEVVMLGECKAKSGGSISAGQFVVPNSDGDVVAVTLGTGTTNVAVGRALEDADSGDIIRVMVNPGFIQV
jgi:membrane-bound inhibitor of C-type lysozyme